MKIFGIEAKETHTTNIGLTEWRVILGQYCGVIHQWTPNVCSYGSYHWHLTPPYPGKLIDGWAQSLDECASLINQTLIDQFTNRSNIINKIVDDFHSVNKDVEEFVRQSH